jgi:hypothetical protein
VVSDNGDSASDSASDGVSSGQQSLPRLTVGQRILTSLPNLQRPPKPVPERSPDRPSGAPAASPAPRNSGAPDSDVDDETVVSPDEVLTPGTDPSASRSRFRDSFMKPPTPRAARGAPSGMSASELNHIIKRIDDREQALAYFSAPLGAVVGIILTVAALHMNPAVHVKNHVSPSLIVFEGGARVVLSAVVALAAWKRRRSFVAFALLFLGTSMGFLFALPFWILGIWLIFRVLKWQKELATLTGGRARPRADTGTSARTRTDAPRGLDAAEARRRARAERMRTARTAGGRRAKKQPEPPGPPRNKRYTPPNTVRPKPPGS